MTIDGRPVSVTAGNCFGPANFDLQKNSDIACNFGRVLPKYWIRPDQHAFPRFDLIFRNEFMANLS